ncbi:hypothetical protein [Streptomyces sp. NBC_00198]|uniref:hypothetical protein n=1 Tax=Streptomyces sp. NBC_00198 TaxID=2975677 RepID=UPI00225A7C09|nr:hypothetical protein [Streptomyces sp. NBC_00198]MCX5284105.1 hypothetical protein [Streptomyces sp. NBC_00198]
MSRGEETDEPNTGGDPAVPGKPMDLGKPDTVGEASEPAPRFAVVISGDGSAAIDGEPVPASAGTTVDAAILDVLHGYARDLNTTVTATISDPSAGYVAFVEVAPDGSSSLLDQQEQQEPQQEPTPPPAPVPLPVPAPEHTGPPPAEAELTDGTEDFAEERAAEGDGHGAYAEDADDDYDDDSYDGDAAGAYEDDDEEDHHAEAAEAEADDDDDDDDGYDVEAYALEQQRLREAAPLPPPPPAPNAPSSSYASAPSYADDDADDDEAADFGADSGREEGFPVAGAAAARPAPQLVRRPGSRQSDDEYRGPGLLHRPMVVGPVGLVVAALVIVPLVILGSGGSDDGGHRKEAARSSEETSKSPQAGKPGPISTSSPSLPPPPSVSASPSPKPKKSKDAKKETKRPGGGGGVVVTITARPPQATVTAKPAQDTAASAVKRLARNDPSGRHICYRAFVSGQGWQKPVCDGTMAGTTNQNRPIKALNIAVSGSGGSSANAFVHNSASKDGRGKWMPQWTPVRADGANNYIGSTKKGAPNMSGFAINVGTGRVCQLAKVHSFDWGGQGCADARPGYIFGGALENDRYLEAVKFTV